MKERGITLIALVITIIVMLILAAVTITMAVNGGLFEYAQNASVETSKAISEEANISTIFEQVIKNVFEQTDITQHRWKFIQENVNGQYSENYFEFYNDGTFKSNLWDDGTYEFNDNALVLTSYSEDRDVYYDESSTLREYGPIVMEFTFNGNNFVGNEILYSYTVGDVNSFTQWETGNVVELFEMDDTEINFSIDNQDLVALNGMTWEEWVDSDYNTLGFYVYRDHVFSEDNRSVLCDICDGQQGASRLIQPIEYELEEDGGK